MAARLSVARTARQLTSSAVRRPPSFVPATCQRWQQAPLERRLFSVSAAVKEKKYTEDHEWIELSSDGKTCTLGISDYAAKALGDVVYIELPQIDMDISAGDTIGAVESVKSASDILTPIGGKVTEVNSQLEAKPGSINADPEGEGWIAKLEVAGEPEGKLMSKDEYTAFTEDA
ncbi:glycine cleavage system H protein, mitochondrial precursor [Lindgomyces ingoldianus]|uniref:Glycine cleavage system H protein, mitochondrial n=1 Tax=Lindgomyces ingoldianus TaxID=673940 RepID=A0ACB6QH26_9PLEO|nr:glycine cleavage system H protein, mitochondrial precursor [Lindgomyces ingoldianus]KAF2466185.1 glycine cleavage system H protein, mitochondrial precursor [Lindgomyces ingoldianus]